MLEAPIHRARESVESRRLGCAWRGFVTGPTGHVHDRGLGRVSRAVPRLPGYRDGAYSRPVMGRRPRSGVLSTLPSPRLATHPRRYLRRVEGIAARTDMRAATRAL